MFLGIGVWLGLAFVASSSPLKDGAAQTSPRLQKRDWVLECDNDAPIPVPLERYQFETLGDLCKGYPHGAGIICDSEGHRTQRTPMSLILRMYGNDLAHVCLSHCRCSDIAPDAPIVQEALSAQFNECSISNETIRGPHSEPAEEPSTSTSCPRTGYQALVDSCTCNEYWYGRPNNADCVRALSQLPDHGATTQIFREFLPIGQNSHHIWDEREPVRMPIINTYGHCSVAVLLPEGPGTSASIVVNTLELNQAAEELRGHCVQGAGIGGKFHQSRNLRLEQVSDLPDIVLYAPDSMWKEFLETKYNCPIGANGKGKCKSSPRITKTKSGINGVWKYTGTTGKQGWTKVASKDSNKHRCRGSCLNPSDCDVNSDCICASNRGMLLSSTWGQHSCMYVAGAAAAISAAAIKPQVCKGRCLLQQNGTFGSVRPLNSANTTVISFDATNDMANFSYPFTTIVNTAPAAPAGTASTTVVLGNTTDPLNNENDHGVASADNSTALDSYPETSPSDPSDPDYPVVNATADNSNNQPNEEINGVPTVANSRDDSFNGNVTAPPPEYAIFNDTSSNDVNPLTCPCNCTYVSAACCLSDSGIVYEDPSMQVPVAPLPADEPVCCDVRTGQFLWKSSGECSGPLVNGTAADFIGLGSRLWNSTFDNPIGFPDDENNT